MHRRALPLLLLLLAGCGGTASEQAAVDPLDEELAAARTGDSGDPLLMSVLSDPLMTDPQLSTRANANSVRPPSQPYGAPLPSPLIGSQPDDSAAPPAAPAPTACVADCRAATQALTLAALAAEQRAPGLARCAGRLRYAARWAVRLPAELALSPDARVIEAAGADACDLRAVSYIAPRPLARVIDDFYARTTAAGYRVQHQSDGTQHVLRGARDRDGGAFLLVATARDDESSEVTLLADKGR